MNFQVIWKQQAEAGMAAVWNASDDRTSVTRAARRLDLALESDPIDLGESREAEDRIHFDPPLMIWFRVDVESNLVTVLHCGPAKR